MSVTYRSTDDPDAEQWHLLSRFAYPSNIERYLKDRGYLEIDAELVEIVAGAMRQSEAFFAAARNAPLDISPLLLYYGATNLLMSAAALLTNTILPIKNHGMSYRRSQVVRLADIELVPKSPQEGALQLFSNVFSNGCSLTNGASWTMLEILGSIPDLKEDFERHYADATYYVVPIEIVKTRQRDFERIRRSELERYPSLQDVFARITDFDAAYLSPQVKGEFVVLNYKRNGKEISNYSISGNKYLRIGHLKNGSVVDPDQLILLYMGLYALGFLPRYHPELWSPFVRGDTTGERYIVERFVSVCARYVPNLVINRILDTRLAFFNNEEGTLDLRSIIERDELMALVKEQLRDLQRRGEL